MNDMTDIPSFQPKPFVFVLMPFKPEFDDIYRYGIKEACEKAGTYAERVDEQIFQGSILDRIYNQIAKADIIIADMTGRNPNVFYETGYAHALGKPTILLTQHSDDIPFDLKHHYHIVYGGRIGNLASQLEPRVRSFADNLSQRDKLKKSGLFILVNGVEIVGNENTIIEFREVKAMDAPMRLTLLYVNAISDQIKTHRFQPTLIYPRKFGLAYARGYAPTVNDQEASYSTIADDDDRILLLLNEPLELMPGAFCTIKLTLIIPDRAIREGMYSYPMSIRILLESGPEEYPFTVHVHTKPSNYELGIHNTIEDTGN